MRKINISAILISVLLISCTVLLRESTVFAAAEPGCYARTTTSTQKVTCPTEGLARATSSPSNKCYVAFVSTQGQGDFTDTDCSTITASAPAAGGGTGGTDPSEELGFAPVANNEGKHVCGRGTDNTVTTAFDFGCVGGDTAKFTGETLNPIVDIMFALFRFLSAGVGLVVIGSIVLAGIQYTASRGDPQATGASIKRISNSLIALLIYTFMFAIANYLVPGGMFL